MPGVPSGRGCEGCRIQKKKCDQARPSCSRCTRLRLVCVGSGQRRYKFKEERGFRNTLTKGQARKTLTSHNKINAVQTVPCTPSNDLTLVVNAFIETIRSSTDLRYNLAWMYGAFLEDVPRRLGTNEALDTSVGALIVAHSNICSHRGVTTDALIKYSRALNKLRLYLDDPAKACASETLCAVMLLLICQHFIGVTERRWTGHCEGAAQILKARRYYDPQDGFESKLLLSLRGPVVFEGLLNSRIQFSSWEWKTLVANHLDGDTFEGQMMRCLSRVPDFMQRGKTIRRGEGEDPKLLDEMRSNYQTLKAMLRDLHGRLAAVQRRMANESPQLAPVVQAHSYFQRSYSLALTIAIILNCVLRAIDIENNELSSESTCFSKEILALAEGAAKYRPLGASYVPLCLCAAWVGTADCSIRSLVERALAEYQQDFPQGQEAMMPSRELERVSRQLCLLDLDPP